MHGDTVIHRVSVLPCVIVSLWFKKADKGQIVQECDATIAQ